MSQINQPIAVLEDARQEIAGKASTLVERIGDSGVQLVERRAESTVEHAFREWVGIYGSDQALTERLELSGWTPSEVKKAFHIHRGSEEAASYKELEPLFLALREIDNLNRFSTEEELVAEADPIPFEDLLLPFTIHASQKAGLRRTQSLISDNAWISLQRWLVQRLSKVSSKVLHVEFSQFSKRKSSFEDDKFGYTKNNEIGKSTKNYELFVRHYFRNIITFFKEYAALARSFSNILGQWINVVTTFISRFRKDRKYISRKFLPEGARAKVKEIKVEMGDIHEGGHCVMGLELPESVGLFYKPRPLSPELGLTNFFRWLNTKDTDLELQELDIIERPNYGWVRRVQPAPKSSDAEAKRYYRRSGMVACSLYLLEACDFHRGNLIPAGEHPVPIDAETILHPDSPSETSLGKKSSPGDAAVLASKSVLKTYLFPPLDKEVETDVSALGTGGVQQVGSEKLTWKNINTDTMKAEYVQPQVKLTHNFSEQDTEDHLASEYSHQIKNGFEEAYQTILRHRSELSDPSGQLENLKEIKTRYLFRSTGIYHRALQTLSSPKHSRSGIQQSLYLEKLGKKILSEPGFDKSRFWNLCLHEKKALRRRIVPRFSIDVRDGEIQSGYTGRSLACHPGRSGWEKLQARVRKFSPEDRLEQTALIETALNPYSLESNVGSSQPDRVKRGRSDQLESKIEVSCRKIAAEIRRRAIPRSKSIYWIRASRGRKQDHQSSGEGLYYGRVGTALYLSALFSSSRIKTKSNKNKKFARLALQPLKEKIRKHPKRLLEKLGVGGADGIASIAYGLTHVGKLLGDDSTVSCAYDLARTIEPSTIKSTSEYGVLDGIAGTLLSMTNLYNYRQFGWLKERIDWCRKELLERLDDCGPSKNSTDRLIGGFAHGVSGIAYALSRAFNIDRKKSNLYGIKRAIKYEMNLYEPNENNWVDLRKYEEEKNSLSFQDAWCHGRTGIGISMLGIRKNVGINNTDGLVPKEKIEKALRRAIKGVQNAQLKSRDHLCCGESGRVDFLHEAGRKLGSSSIVSSARGRAATLVERRNEKEGFLCHSHIKNRIYDASFFQGTAGIGYTLLRLLEPSMPCVLLWE